MSHSQRKPALINQRASLMEAQIAAVLFLTHQADYSQASIAHYLGCTPSAVSRVMARENLLSPERTALLSTLASQHGHHDLALQFAAVGYHLRPIYRPDPAATDEQAVADLVRSLGLLLAGTASPLEGDRADRALQRIVRRRTDRAPQAHGDSYTRSVFSAPPAPEAHP